MRIMESSSKIPHLVNSENGVIAPEMGPQKVKQQQPRKISLTDQGKAAKLLRKRLAFALATPDTKIKSDSGTSASEASDHETVAKDLKAGEERKSSIPRKISEEIPKKSSQAKQLLGAIGDRIKIRASETNRKFATVSLSNGVENIGVKDNLLVDLQNQKETKQTSMFVSNKNDAISNNNTAGRLSREPASRDVSLPTTHERGTKNREPAFGSPNGLHRLEIVEAELLKLRADSDKTLEDFRGISRETERVKMKLEELRRERIDYGQAREVV